MHCIQLSITRNYDNSFRHLHKMELFFYVYYFIKILCAYFGGKWIFLIVHFFHLESFPFIIFCYFNRIVFKIASFDYCSFKILFPALRLWFLDKGVYVTLNERTLLWRWHTPLHPETLFPFLLYVWLPFVTHLWLFCHDYDEAYKVGLPNSRNLRISHRVGEIDSKIKSSFIFKSFIVHYTFKRPHE